MNPIAVYLYDLRITSEQQTALTELEEQEIIDYCNKNNFVIIERVVDNLDSFTSISDQVNLINLLAKTNQGITVICYSMHRLTRDFENHLNIKKTLNKFSRLLIMELPLDLYTTNGHCVYQMLAATDAHRWQHKYNKTV
jgi:DNA invertase Pin-like site-specific DNA recombinase